MTNIILYSHGEERRQYIEWLEQPSELITKSIRFEQLVNQTCICSYKKSSNSLSEDTTNFIRRSIHEMLRSKSTKDDLRNLLLSTPPIGQGVDPMMGYDYSEANLYMAPHSGDAERILSVDLMNGIRQPMEKELPSSQQRSTDNIAL